MALLPSSSFDVGGLLRVSVVFTDFVNNPKDPGSVLFKMMNPAGTITTYTYGVGSNLVKDSGLGAYHVDVDLNTPGTWLVRFEGTAPVKAAVDGTFQVDDSPLK